MKDKKYFREASIRKANLESDQRTIRMSFSSEKAVLREDDYGDLWIEVLSHEPSDVDLSRLNSKAPFLIDHKREREYHAGSINRAWIESKRGICEVRLSNREEMRGVIEDIADGILTNVSVGYFVTEKSETGTDENGIPIFRCKWQPYEISALSIPADSDVGIGRKHPLTNQEQTMENQPNKPNEEQIRAEAIQAEQTRQSDIRGHFKMLYNNKYPDLMEECIQNPEITFERAMERVRDLANAQPPGNQTSGNSIAVREGDDYGAQFRTAATEGQLLKNGIQIEPTVSSASDFRNMTLVDLAKTCLSRSGATTSGFSTSSMIQRAYQLTTDFPSILGDVARNSIMKGYEHEPATHRIWCGNADVKDYREHKFAQLSEAPALLLTAEGAEYTDGTFGDSEESVLIARYGRIFGLTHEAIVNDNLNAFTRVPQAFGQSAARLEADSIYSVLTTNPNMSDSNPIFDAANHSNLMTAEALTVESLGKARQAMRRQKGILNLQILNVTPRYLIVPAALETKAEELVYGIIQPGKSNDIETPPFIRNLEIVVEARLDEDSETAWYLAADYNQIETVVLAHLQGHAFDLLEEPGFKVDGMQWRARHIFGTKCLDWKGLIKNPGV